MIIFFFNFLLYLLFFFSHLKVQKNQIYQKILKKSEFFND